MRKKWFFIAPLAILALVAFIALGGEVVLQLWNWLLPPLFGLRQITFWQALGILALCRILFGGFGFHGSDSSQSRRRGGGRWWDRMSPEEREKFWQAVRTHVGLGPSASETTGQ